MNNTVFQLTLIENLVCAMNIVAVMKHFVRYNNNNNHNNSRKTFQKETFLARGLYERPNDKYIAVKSLAAATALRNSRQGANELKS